MNPRDRWIVYRRPVPSAAVRLFCFPHAGGDASVFIGWNDLLPPSIEVCPVQLPGRGARLAEPLVVEMAPLVDALVDALAVECERPFALYGHSLGALVAFELAQALRARAGLTPWHLFVSAHGAPQACERERPIHHLPDDEFVREVQQLEGTPPGVLDDRELREILVPILRADFTLCETYQHQPRPPLPCPVTVFGGLGDVEVPRERLEAWQPQTTGPFRLRMLPGGHFFIQSAKPTLLGIIARELAEDERGQGLGQQPSSSVRHGR